MGPGNPVDILHRLAQLDQEGGGHVTPAVDDLARLVVIEDMDAGLGHAGLWRNRRTTALRLRRAV